MNILKIKLQKCENALRNLAEFLECGADAFFLVFRLESQGAEVPAQFLLAQSEQSALCTFFSLIPKAYDEPPLVVAVFHFPGFSAALPCRAGRLLLFSPRRVFAPGCYFENVAFRGFPIGFQRCQSVKILSISSRAFKREFSTLSQT